MIAINSTVTDPYLNHAIEEVMLQKEDECFILWKNAPCILLGKNQNAYSEINTEYIRLNNISLVRRITGGGTVYNDFGNLNFTFIAKRESVDFADFKRFTVPVIAALQKLGIPAEFKGRNDLVIEDKKFSGNAQCWLKDKVLHHGTLLFNTDLTALAKSLNVSKLKLLSKGIQSTKSRVCNISDYINTQMDIYQFKEYLFNEVAISLNADIYNLTNEDISKAQIIADEKYRKDSWNYNEKNNFSILKEDKFAGGILSSEILVKDGFIENIVFYGDFFSVKDSSEISAILKGSEYSYETIRQTLSKIDLDNYFKNITIEEILSIII